MAPGADRSRLKENAPVFAGAEFSELGGVLRALAARPREQTLPSGRTRTVHHLTRDIRFAALPLQHGRPARQGAD